MASEFGESKPTSSASSFSENNNGNNNNNPNDAGDFECNICFDLAQDPIVTLCGHLFCWPCLYRWLNHHSHSHECPVCKALIEEGKLVPLYGRGKAQSDPRSKSYPGMDDVPRRPAGQRPHTATPPPHPHQDGNNHFGNFGFALMGGLGPMATARFGNFTFSTGFGGLSLFPGLFNMQFNGFQDPAAGYGTTGGGFGYGVHGLNTSHGHARGHGVAQQMSRGEQADNALKNLMFFIGFFVVMAMLFLY